MSKIDDRARLLHMLDAAKTALELASNETRASLDTDIKLSLSLVRLVEIMGEAANNVSPEKQTELSDIPWRQIVGMRNRIVHAYFEVDLNIVWRTVNEEFPALVTILERSI